MKKLLLATAVAAASTLSTGAHALVTSNIVGIELWIQDPFTLVFAPAQTDCATGTANPGFVTRLALSGVNGAPGAINFVGQVCLDIGGGSPFVALDFNLQGGDTVAPAPVGSVYDAGNVDYYTDFGSGWIYAGTVAANATPIDCVANPPGAVGFVSGNPVALPGAPLPVGAPTNAACETTILGIPARLYLN